MTINRRRLLAHGTGFALATTVSGTAGPPSLQRARADFPAAGEQVYLNAASSHPLSIQSLRAMNSYLSYKTNGPGPGRQGFGEEEFGVLRSLFARLINARSTEIAFVQSTLVGENLVIHGLGLPGSASNVVTDELHYNGALYMYRMLQKAGLDVRIVKRRGWSIDPQDIEQAVDSKTRLISAALVSNINGFTHNAKFLSELAHAHKAYFYADIIQAAGCMPIDVQSMGIDFAACSCHKWLMGERGLGYLYVREDLQQKVLKPTHFGFRQYRNFQYHDFPFATPSPEDFSWESRAGAACYEVGNVSNVVAAGQREALLYILSLGAGNIQNHAKPLVSRLQKEIPRLGYPSITPPGGPSPIASFLVKDAAGIRAKLLQAKVIVTINWNQMRISPSVFNTQEDVDRLLEVLDTKRAT